MHLFFGNEFTKNSSNHQIFDVFLLLSGTQLLYVNSVLHLQALQYRWLVELLTCAKFLYNTCLLEFSLKLFEGLFDVLAFLYRYNNHLFLCFKFYVKLMPRAQVPRKAGAKLQHIFELCKFFLVFLIIQLMNVNHLVIDASNNNISLMIQPDTIVDKFADKAFLHQCIDGPLMLVVHHICIMIL